MQLTAAEETRFWLKVLPPNENGCRLWSDNTNKDGYGQVRIQDKMCKAHRIAYLLSIGPVPEGFNVCHKCDIPACCNPAHLFLGTQSDNLRDMREKGRAFAAYGERHGSSKLTESDVLEIRNLYAKGEKQRILADLFGISQVSVSSILLRKTWSHV